MTCWFPPPPPLFYLIFYFSLRLGRRCRLGRLGRLSFFFVVSRLSLGWCGGYSVLVL